ncbi:MAG: AmmeMemoRadiSam system radical SAM enzyme [Deltaproteobacteria bacterium]|nr:AmmeMemoRadiSam system radical SAM enzyme [Deltaproteobacteria bacterium]
MADDLLTADLLRTDLCVVPVGFGEPQDDARLLCTLCPRACKLRDGQRGLCYVRGRIGDQMVLTTYGRSSGFCVDPIEKKPLNHFLPGSAVLSFGTAGCNLSCAFCQNWSISKSRQMDTLGARAEPEAIARAAVQAGCASVAFTYNDPVIFFEYARDVAVACRRSGLKTVAVTAGYITEAARAAFFECFDAANVDLKAFTEAFYVKTCGGHLQPVLDTLAYLAREGTTWTEVTTLLIPGLNDGDAEIAELAGWLVAHMGPDVPLHFSAFHPDYKLVDRPPTPPPTLSRARAIAKAAGLRHVYTGNVHDPAGGSTVCHGCSLVLVERDWYELGAYRLRDGRCPDCGAVCAGVWTAEAGTWGRKRRPLRIG